MRRISSDRQPFAAVEGSCEQSGAVAGLFITLDETGADGLIYCTQEADGSNWIGGRSATISSGGELPVFE